MALLKHDAHVRSTALHGLLGFLALSCDPVPRRQRGAEQHSCSRTRAAVSRHQSKFVDSLELVRAVLKEFVAVAQIFLAVFPTDASGLRYPLRVSGRQPPRVWKSLCFRNLSTPNHKIRVIPEDYGHE